MRLDRPFTVITALEGCRFDSCHADLKNTERWTAAATSCGRSFGDGNANCANSPLSRREHMPDRMIDGYPLAISPSISNLLGLLKYA